MLAVEQAATDASWTDVIAEQNLGASHAPRPTPQMDSNHGWDAIVAGVEREQTQSNSVSSGASSKADRDWTEIMSRMNAQNGAGA
jgi:hypothetical protein